MKINRSASVIAGLATTVLLAAGCSGAPGDAGSAQSSGKTAASGTAAAGTSPVPAAGASATASAAPAPRWTPTGSNLVAWSDPTRVSHLFYHSLIVDPKRAFSSKMATGYRDYMVTVTEFRHELDQLYARGYVLVHPERLAAPGPGGTMTATPLMLPPGKKPLVLSIDDVNYYEYMTGDGFATDLFFTSDGHLANHYTDASGATQVGSYDVAPIVDDFVRAHPDFSYDGDKGTLALTGYNGALGYRSSIHTYGDTPATHAAITAATNVATAMKSDGWNFASHSWGHINFTKASLAKIQADTARWDAEVRPITGPTKEFIYPFGADISGIAPYTEKNAKYHFLHDTEGYDYFFPIDATKPAWGQLAAGSLRQARINVDGISLTRAMTRPTNVLWTFFDHEDALDPARTQIPATAPTGHAPGAATGSVAGG